MWLTLPSLPVFVYAPFLYKGRQRPSTHGFKTKGRQTRSERKKRPSISTPRFNRKKGKLTDIKLALLRRGNIPTVPLLRPPLPLRRTAHTVSPHDRWRTRLSATRLSIRLTRVIIIIVMVCDPHLHLSAHRITYGISRKFYPSRLRQLRAPSPSRGD